MRYLTAFILLLPGLALAQPLPDFDAWYTTTKYGLSAARTHISYRHTPANNTYYYSSTSKAAGVVSVFRSDIISEGSTGKLINGNYRPTRYHFIHTRGSKTRKHFVLRFLWGQHKAVGTLDGTSKTHQLNKGAIDRFILQVAIMRAMQKNPQSLTYTIVDKHKVKQWTFRVSGTETVSVPAGKIKTIKLVRQHGQKNRTTYLYAAPSLKYLPVRMTFVERDGSKFSMNLTRHSGLK